MLLVDYLNLIISLGFQIYTWLIVARVVISFFRPRRYHPAIRFIYEVTEPLLGFVRRLLPPAGLFDFSPLVAVIFLEIARPIVIILVIKLFTLGG